MTGSMTHDGSVGHFGGNQEIWKIVFMKEGIQSKLKNQTGLKFLEYSFCRQKRNLL